MSRALALGPLRSAGAALHTPVTAWHRPARLPTLSVACESTSYNFSDASNQKAYEGRPARVFVRREARTITTIVRGLTAMSGKQLGAVSHLLPPGSFEAVQVASRIPRSNQVRMALCGGHHHRTSRLQAGRLLTPALSPLLLLPRAASVRNS